MADPAPSPSTVRSRLGLVGTITFIGSTFLAFNTFVVSCASERASRDAAQLHDIEEKEKFWTDAMQELADIVKDRDAPADTTAASGKATTNYDVRCLLLARRTAPFQDSVADQAAADPDDVPSAQVAELTKRVDKLKQVFFDQISAPEIVGPACTQTFKKSAEVEKQRDVDATAVRKDTPWLTDAQADAIAAKRETIVLSPYVDSGWDVDVFWCQADANRPDGQDPNFANALAVGKILAGYSLDGRPLLNPAATGSDPASFPLGRVRVRLLARDKYAHGFAGYLGQNAVVGTADEQSMVAAIRQVAPPEGRFGPFQNRMVTKFYVSAFACAFTKPLSSAPAAPPAAS